MNNTTPAPWDVEPTRDHGAAYRVMDCQEVTVALCYQQPHDTWRAKDNASLIAAAPELQSAVRGLLNVFAPHARETVAKGGMDVLQSDVRRAIEALIKSEGKS